MDPFLASIEEGMSGCEVGARLGGDLWKSLLWEANEYR
jgi:hypothetical protein